jgi:hypothetical protein
LIFGVLMPLSAISWQPVLVVEEAGVPGENHDQTIKNIFKLFMIVIGKRKWQEI